jgi:hypothetical protein
MPPSALAKKLMLKPGQRGLVLNPPTGFAELLGELPEGVDLAFHAQVPAIPPGPGQADFVHLFVKDRTELAHWAPLALQAVKYDGLLWLSYPKRSSKVPTDITRDTGWDVVRQAGLEPISQISIDDVWSALRFRPSERVGK